MMWLELVKKYGLYLLVFFVGVGCGWYVKPDTERVINVPYAVIEKADPQVITKYIDQPYAVTKEIIREVQTGTPTTTPPKNNPDFTFSYKEPVANGGDTRTVYVDVTLDRKNAIGPMIYKGGYAIEVDHAISKDVEIGAFHSVKGDKMYGASIKYRF